MNRTEIRKYVDEMLDRADIRVLRIIYRVLLGLTTRNRTLKERLCLCRAFYL